MLRCCASHSTKILMNFSSRQYIEGRRSGFHSFSFPLPVFRIVVFFCNCCSFLPHSCLCGKLFFFYWKYKLLFFHIFFFSWNLNGLTHSHIQFFASRFDSFFHILFIHMAKIYVIILFLEESFYICNTDYTVAMRYCIAVGSARSSSPGILAFSHEIPMEQSRIGPLICYAMLPARFSIYHYIKIFFIFNSI